MKATIVDSVQTALGPIILAANSWEESVLVAQRDIKGVDSVVLTADYELCEDNCRLAVQCGVTDVVLPRTPMRGVKNKVSRGLVIGRCRRDRGHVRSMAGLCHRKATRRLE